MEWRSRWNAAVWTGMGVAACIGGGPETLEAATVYTDSTAYRSALSAVGVGTQSVLGLEDLPAGTALDDDYAGLGVRFSSSYGISIATNVHGSTARGTVAAQVATGTNPSSCTFLFDAAQKGIGFYALDIAYALTVQAYDSGGLRETFTISPFAEDTAGGIFQGIVFAAPVTRVVINAQLGDGIGFDDLSFSSLDADGDGYGPGAGRKGNDCNDSDNNTYPGATEVADGKDQDCDGIVDNVLSIFSSEPGFEGSADDEGIDFLTVIDYEDLISGADVTEAYAGLGVVFSANSSLLAGADISGSTPNGKLGVNVGSTNKGNFVWFFNEPQSHLAARFLDLAAPLAVQAYDDGGLIYQFSLDAIGEDTPGGFFRGFSFYLPVTRVVFTSTATNDGIGFDDVQFVSLDLDGDGFGPASGRRGGDCDDADPNTYPGAIELDGDGKDQDCDGLIDNAVTLYTNPTTFQSDGLGSGIPAFRKVDFEGLSEGAIINTQYTGLGVNLLPSTGVTAEKSVHGSGARGTRAARVTSTSPGSFTWVFSEPQRFVSAYFLDLSGGLSVAAYRGTTLLYTLGLSAPGEDLSGGIFRGFGFSQAVDKVVFTGSSGDGIGYDDLLFDPVDDDADGITSSDGDCDDEDASVYPGASERCNGKDDDCDTLTDEGFDQDDDGVVSCAAGGSAADCNDADAEVAPGLEETCDRKDNDCDSSIDEGFDQDADGISSCAAPTPDCNDSDASVKPGAAETCNGIDDDCDGIRDEGFDKDSDDFYTCALEGRAADCDDHAPDTYPGATDSPYNGIDEDCSGADLSDVDGDGYAGGASGNDCADTNPEIYPGASEIPYNGIDEDCSGSDLMDVDGDGFSGPSDSGEDCDDHSAFTYPGAPEIDDDADNDCDDEIDEDLDTTDDDDDGFSEASGDCDDTNSDVYPGGVEIPYNHLDDDCMAGDLNDVDGDGYDGGSSGNDCDDHQPSTYPGAAETPYNGIDEDCSGADLTDKDGDTFAGGPTGPDCNDSDPSVNPGATETPYDGVDQDCSGGDLKDVDQDGFAATQADGTDCADTNPAVYPGALELADGLDNDCDGIVDNETDSFDDDLDGFSEDEGDCNDANAAVYPGASEIPFNGIDEDCSSADLTDVDGDGYEGGLEGEDCNDSASAIHPDAEEICGDSTDENCDGVAEDCPITPTPGTDETPTPSEASPTPGTDETPTPSEASPSPGDTPGETPTPDPGGETGGGCSCDARGSGTSSRIALLLLVPVAWQLRRKRERRA